MNRDNLERTARKVAREVRYLQALVLINLIYGAVALGMSISAIVTTISPAFSMDLSALNSVLTLQSVATVALAAVILGLAGRWLIHTAEMFDAVENLEKPRAGMMAAQDAEARAERVVGLIVELLSNYREHRGSIRAFRILGKASGLLFIGLGFLGLIQTLLASPNNINYAVLNLAATIPPGLAGLYISHSFGKYQDAWDPRLIGASRAEEILKKLLEGP